MKWLHLSDLHISCTDHDKGGAEENKRKLLLKYLKDNRIKVNEIFVTGDLHSANIDTNQIKTANCVSNYLKKIANTTLLEIDYDKHIHMVPGNHDCDILSDKNYLYLKSIYNYYLDRSNNMSIKQNDCEVLRDRFSFYKLVLDRLYTQDTVNKIWDNLKNNVHRCIMSDSNKYAILCLNTSIFCNETDRGGNLCVIIDDVMRCLNINPMLKNEWIPLIILGHHGPNMLRGYEQQFLSRILSQYNIFCYLCGHEHDSSFTNNETYTRLGVGKNSFIIGELNLDTGIGIVNAHKFENMNWCPDNGFSVGNVNTATIKCSKIKSETKHRFPLSDDEKNILLEDLISVDGVIISLSVPNKNDFINDIDSTSNVGGK